MQVNQKLNYQTRSYKISGDAFKTGKGLAGSLQRRLTNQALAKLPNSPPLMGCLLPVRVMQEQKSILKTKYWRPSEVANAHIQSIMGLPVITGTNPVRICDFYEKQVTNIQTLESMRKEKEIRGYVRLTLDKLPGIGADLVRLDDYWQEWGFPQLLEALRKWCERNPVPLDSYRGEGSWRHDRGNDKALQTKQGD